VDNQQAIAVNYWTCVFTGLIFSNALPHLSAELYQNDWAKITFGLGMLFIIVFFGMAVTAQKFGISVSVIAAKMGVIFPVLFAFLYLKEAATFYLLLGIFLSLASVYFVSQKDRTEIKVSSKRWVILLPALVLIGSGIIDLTLKIIELDVGHVPVEVPTIMIFFSAAIFGTLLSIYRYVTGSTSFKWVNVLGGITLGVPNYFSIYFLFKALQSELLNTSQVYPLNNMGVVVLSTVLSILIFREHLNRKNIIGIVMALLAIVLISWPI
jgi:uncharacterized membrane protein